MAGEKNRFKTSEQLLKVDNKNCIELFEEFFNKYHKKDIIELVNHSFIGDRSLTVDYNILEIFNPNLVDLLVEKPEEGIDCAEQAIRNIITDIEPYYMNEYFEVRFINILSYACPVNSLTTSDIGSFTMITGIIEKINKPQPVLDIGVFQCNGCAHTHDVKQPLDNTILVPTLCGECGGKSFKLLQEKSTYTNEQILLIGNKGTSRKLKVILRGDLCSWDNYNIGELMDIIGILKVNKINNKSEYVLYCNNIYKSDKELFVEEDYIDNEKQPNERSSQEYNDWRKRVINRDKVCKLCGGDKHLHAHHIYSYKDNPDLRIDVGNGITLCQFCHDKYHSYYGKNSNPHTLIEFIKRFKI